MQKNDSSTNLKYFKDKVKEFVEQRGWTKYHTPKNLIQALSIEVAELNELFLFKEEGVDEILNNPEKLKKISDEVADIFIYLISFINTLDLDLTESFNLKMEKNDKKYSVDEFNKGYYRKK